MAWYDMKKRCLTHDFKQYKDYGGRGITICPEWTDKENGFINFRDWSLVNGYQEDLEIDRINNDGNYSPENCRWIAHKINCRNTRKVKLSIKIANEIRELYKTNKYTMRDLAKKYKINVSIINGIIHNKRWY